MCGILLYTDPTRDFTYLQQQIAHRGPDSTQLITHDGIAFFSSVLSLRSPFTAQPLIDEDFVLQFNGELYNDEISGNDTRWIQQMLQETGDVVPTIRSLDGEFAYVIYQRSTRTISFGRDPVGKRSLVWSTAGDQLVVASVHPIEDREQYTDCLNGVIYQYNLDTHALTMIPNDTHYNINPNTDKDLTHISERVSQLHSVLSRSVAQRLKTIHPLHTSSTPFSILFSGGLDCTVIASLCAQLSPADTSIDLLNVAFDNPRTGLTASEAPDRQLAIQTWLSLCKTHPTTTFNLIEIDVPYSEYQDIRPKVIELMYPKNTEMDLSIAIAFYFASRGRGSLLSCGDDGSTASILRQPGYKSTGKVLFSGLGADELYGGYHKFANKDSTTLVPELEKQINGIHERNLMRDDKVISDNGVEVRYPFLSHDVIKFSTEEIEINYKVNKLILRELAKTLGLGFVAEEPKRAIQFGSKSAKITQGGKIKGTDSLS